MIIESDEKEPRHSRHLLAVKVTGSLLLALLKASAPRVIACKGIPPDAKVFRMEYDTAFDLVVVVFEHPTFPLRNEGDLIAETRPSFSEYYGDAAIEALKHENPPGWCTQP